MDSIKKSIKTHRHQPTIQIKLYYDAENVWHPRMVWQYLVQWLLGQRRPLSISSTFDDANLMYITHAEPVYSDHESVFWIDQFTQIQLFCLKIVIYAYTSQTQVGMSQLSPNSDSPPLPLQPASPPLHASPIIQRRSHRHWRTDWPNGGKGRQGLPQRDAGAERGDVSAWSSEWIKGGQISWTTVEHEPGWT